MKDKVDIWIEHLLDPNARLDERDDIGMDASRYPDPRFIDPLFKMACNLDESIGFAQVCAESLAEIWVKLGSYDKDKVVRLPKETVNEVVGIFARRRPDWHKEVLGLLGEREKPCSLKSGCKLVPSSGG